MYSLENAPLHFPEAIKWMWSYCVYLGPYTDFNGKHYDLGIYISPHKSNTNPNGHISAAVVFSNEQGDYISGPVDKHASGMQRELFTRAQALKLMR